MNALFEAGADEKYVDLFKGEAKKPEFLAINPRHAVPAYSEGDDFKLNESVAIAQYLATISPHAATAYPTDPKARAPIDAVVAFTRNDLLKSLVSPFASTFGPIFNKDKDKDWGVEHKRGSANRTYAVDVIENHYLAGGKQYFVGDCYTLADVTVFYLLAEHVVKDQFDLSPFPHTAAFYKRFSEHEKIAPLYQRYVKAIEAADAKIGFKRFK